MSVIEKVKLYFKKRKRAKIIALAKRQIPPYLKKDFSVELNYKLWTTKGARFEASARTKKLHDLSATTIGFLSAYLIIFNMLNVYEISFYKPIPNNYLAFISTAISILILIFSQFEMAKNYNICSEKFHQCAIEIAELYNRLRMVKTFKIHEDYIEVEVTKISNEYDQILKKYENHESIDVSRFEQKKKPYFNMGCLSSAWVNIKYYFLTYLKYHFFKYSPLVCLLVYQFIGGTNEISDVPIRAEFSIKNEIGLVQSDSNCFSLAVDSLKLNAYLK